ncbi:Rhodanese-related sulfurtransferase [Gracilibacillus orientalis]|uniref:Rhodanese-related sulfurtransferase n=1 Tax=Gracilibacillus orientalis TaxID=334253 RepID=A0A1I4LHI2_9BACI|nr:sulfurtransferase TusA family protein [Gracilibacillus orientalis]SFL90430.1 Rhodanese-related sulfurtransferase [Gracilibacillus orientalis]
MDLLKANVVLDATGLACPIPIVKTKKAMKDVEAGQVIEVQATDKGSKADIEAWANSSGHQYLGTQEEGDTLKHYLRKASDEETIEKKHPNTATNEELASKLSENIVVLDVRESAEHAFNHIPSAVSIPLGELEDRINELNKDDEIYVVCRTGSRSDLAAQKLVEIGFKNVVNVLPGMIKWTRETTKLEN